MEIKICDVQVPKPSWTPKTATITFTDEKEALGFRHFVGCATVNDDFCVEVKLATDVQKKLQSYICRDDFVEL